MKTIPASDREILRALAYRQLEFANAPKNHEILKKWHNLAEGKREAPTVRLLFSQNDRTLTREEVMQVVNAIVDDLAAGGIALKNGAALQ